MRNTYKYYVVTNNNMAYTDVIKITHTCTLYAIVYMQSIAWITIENTYTQAIFYPKIILRKVLNQ